MHSSVVLLDEADIFLEQRTLADRTCISSRLGILQYRSLSGQNSK